MTKKLITPRYGEVWSVILDPTVGREQGGLRPAVIISNDSFNRLPHELCIIVPITSTNRNLPTHVAVQASEGGLTHDSVIMCDQVRSISIERLRKRRGELEALTLKQVQQTLGLFIDR